MVKGMESPFEPLRETTFVHYVNQSVLRENKDCLETRRLHSKLKPRKRGVLEDCSATRTPGVRTTTVKGILSPFEPLRVTTAIKDCLETRRLHSKLKKQFSPERTRGVLEDCSATMIVQSYLNLYCNFPFDDQLRCNNNSLFCENELLNIYEILLNTCRTRNTNAMLYQIQLVEPLTVG